VQVSAPPRAALLVFGDRLPIAQRYAELLAGVGVERGLIGPREAERLWDRHLLNCAVIEPAIPAGAQVLDIGSGAGLPGLVLAIARPDLRLELVEPMERRTVFLREAVVELGLDAVTVTRARASELSGPRCDVVTARAVAPLRRLLPEAMPLVRVGGRLLAIKGSSAQEELDAARLELESSGGGSAQVLRFGADVLDVATTVVSIERMASASRRSGGSRA
jgi:16S rRNA (guanine527-N7)-methyltransferase